MGAVLNWNRKTEEIPMKTVYTDVMAEMIEAGMPVVFLDADLMLSLGAVPNWRKYPNRVFNCGIAEANMMGVAAGLSTDGLVPFIHSFVPFSSRRMFDQVFVSGAYARLNVKIIGSDPGICMQLNGGTHCAFEDIAMMRSVPGMTILEPTDNTALKQMLYLAANTYGMFYIRMPRFAVEKIYGEESAFSLGQSAVLREGRDVTILAAGLEVPEALNAAELLAKENISAKVIDILTIKPLDKETVLRAAEETKAVIVAENHSVVGGVGSAVAELLAQNIPVPMGFIGSQEQFGEVGPLDYLQERYEMTAVHIAAKAKAVLAMK